MTDLYLSLGHNSSCVAYDEDSGRVVGYEEERLTKQKSDSSFPRLSIAECLKHVDPIIQTIFVSHWFDHFDPLTKTKYWDPDEVPLCLDIVFTNGEITHHDAHHMSAMAFFRDYATSMSNVLSVVVDGFGTNQEVCSAYYEGSLVSRIHGYEHSMGLLYQHAAEAGKMHPHNDVYKFLGYRTGKILIPYERAQCGFTIRHLVDVFGKAWLTDPGVMQPIHRRRYEDQMREFQLVRQRNIALFLKISRYHLTDIEGIAIPHSRKMIGYVVQEVLEQMVIGHVKMLVEKYPETQTILLSGGCFYNVRLNDYLRRAFPDKNICVMPLAGDQGAAIGLGYAYNSWPRYVFSQGLSWGKRDLVDPENKHIQYVEGVDAASEMILDDIRRGTIVNILTGDMEFGPRALCNTSTISLPWQNSINAINTANGRNTVMPMAPVMLREKAYDFFNTQDINRTVGSDKFMITAHNWTYQDVPEILEGVSHTDLDGTHSGRPQLLDNSADAPVVHNILSNLQCPALVNTSLNTHGIPIIMDSDDFVKVAEDWSKTCPLEHKNYVIK